MATGFNKKINGMGCLGNLGLGIPLAGVFGGAVDLGLKVRFTTPDWVSKQADKIAEAPCRAYR